MKKKLIITLIILIIIGLIGVGAYFLYENHKYSNPMEIEWVRLYYYKLSDNNEELKDKPNSLKNYREDEKIQFCEIKNVAKPLMLYGYTELGQPYENVFYIDNTNTVRQLKGMSTWAQIKYLYNIEEQDFDYYIYETNGSGSIYYKVSDAIRANNENINKQDIGIITESNNYGINILKFEQGKGSSVTTISGDVIELLEFDEKIIKTDVVEDNWVDINLDTYEDKIQKDFSLALKTMNKKLTDNIVAFVKHKEEEVKLRKEQMARAVEEIEQKKQEEEARKLAEEEAKRIAAEEEKNKEEEARTKAEEERRRQEEEARRLAQIEAARNNDNNNNNIEEDTNALTAGNYKLKYGTYKGVDYGTTGDPLSKYSVKIVLKSDGTYTQVNKISSAGIKEKYSGRYGINTQGGNVYLILGANDTMYQITGNNELTAVLSGSGEKITYTGN